MGWEYPSWSHVNGPAVNLLKGGVLTADRVMTVSKVCRPDLWVPRNILGTGCRRSICWRAACSLRTTW